MRGLTPNEARSLAHNEGLDAFKLIHQIFVVRVRSDPIWQGHHQYALCMRLLSRCLLAPSGDRPSIKIIEVVQRLQKGVQLIGLIQCVFYFPVRFRWQFGHNQTRPADEIKYSTSFLLCTRHFSRWSSVLEFRTTLPNSPPGTSFSGFSILDSLGLLLSLVSLLLPSFSFVFAFLVGRAIFLASSSLPSTSESSILLAYPWTLAKLWVCVVWGLIIMVMVYSVGHISGAHLNPAVTITFAIFRHFPYKQVPLYILGQMLGSILASGTLYLMFDVDEDAYFGTVPVGTTGQSLMMEFITSFMLMFVISGVATDNRSVEIIYYDKGEYGAHSDRKPLRASLLSRHQTSKGIERSEVDFFHRGRTRPNREVEQDFFHRLKMMINREAMSHLRFTKYESKLTIEII
ncbi:hypothetical protein TEA_011508 [Camellia sinensis var. sinensis]|uniref:Aquaporin n=1 Tax=Camellia sinensis var. sinensis TaxID=542762 RepID=A0A4S4E7H5_CAMSN|nr:hypothetical protein TEA_011508 [Camellia sinensis var. sinensis]